MDMVKDIESYCGFEAMRMNIEELWNSNPPTAAQGASLHDFLEDVRAGIAKCLPVSANNKKVGASTFLYSNFHSASALRVDYRQKFDKDPFVSKFVQWRWYISQFVQGTYLANSTYECRRDLHRSAAHRRHAASRHLQAMVA